MLLGMLIEKLSGLPYPQFVTDRLFKPLNLQNAVFGDARAVVMRRATTYTQYRYVGARPEQASGTEVLNAEMATMMYPAGGLNISIDDFARWLAALLNGAIISREISMRSGRRQSSTMERSFDARRPPRCGAASDSAGSHDWMAHTRSWAAQVASVPHSSSIRTTTSRSSSLLTGRGPSRNRSSTGLRGSFCETTIEQ